MTPLISPEKLAKLPYNQSVRIIDARSGTDAYDRYLKAHIDHALHVDLDKDLSLKSGSPANGGRHPLPPVHIFSELLGRLGIKPDTHVIIYDDKNGANAAARFWWMMRSLGHVSVQVLDGGLQAAIQKGVNVRSGEEVINQTSSYPVKEWTNTADMATVMNVKDKPTHRVIDVREAYRFKGENEPLDKIAGHIPGAINIPFPENLNQEGSFLSPEQLAEKYNQLISDRDPGNIIVHCGSGVTACHTLLAMEVAGITGPKLYVGSWSEWSSAGKEVAKGDE